MSGEVVARLSELPEGRGRVVTVGDKSIALFRRGAEVLAIDNACPHVGGPLGEGELAGDLVSCPWHGWQFDLRSGAWQRDGGVKVACYSVSVEGDEVRLER